MYGNDIEASFLCLMRTRKAFLYVADDVIAFVD